MFALCKFPVGGSSQLRDSPDSHVGRYLGFLCESQILDLKVQVIERVVEEVHKIGNYRFGSFFLEKLHKMVVGRR